MLDKLDRAVEIDFIWKKIDGESSNLVFNAITNKLKKNMFNKKFPVRCKGTF